MEGTNKKFNFMFYDSNSGIIEPFGFDDPKEPVEMYLGPVSENPEFYEFFKKLSRLNFGETLVDETGSVYTKID